MRENLPMFEEIRIDAVTEANFETVARLGETIWRSHYATMISAAQISFMLAGRYTPDNLRRYLHSDDCWLELVKVSGTPVGYFSYARMANSDEMKLEQLYLLQEYRGRGLGMLMLRHVEAQACKRGLRILILQVNKLNVDSIAFYREAGFTVREEAVFDIGNGFVMDDYVMEKLLRRHD